MGPVLAAIPAVAETYDGLTGRTVLNAFGDRLIGNVDFWSVAVVYGEFTWVRSATFLDFGDGTARLIRYYE